MHRPDVSISSASTPDYNGGFVFPGAIDKVIMAEIKPNGLRKVRVYSMDIAEYVEFGLDENDAPVQGWARYVFGICREILKRGGKVNGFDAVFAGDVPLGAGLSSSAALESCFAFALNDLFNDNSIDKFELARIGQSTEHNYCGVNCGIMDQFASVFGRKGNLMRLDCRSMEYGYFPFSPEDYRLVLVDSRVKHELKDSPYNRRRESCEACRRTSRPRDPSRCDNGDARRREGAISLPRIIPAPSLSLRRKTVFLRSAMPSRPETTIPSAAKCTRRTAVSPGITR